MPALYALMVAPTGASYLGFEYNTDDHMVYAAWMRQAMEGRFFFDNRFTADPQPGLTVHLYFWLLGNLARITGIPLAAGLARVALSALFVPLLYGLVRRIAPSVYATRLAVTLVVLGGGIGFLVWHNFGVLITRPTPETISAVFQGRLPIDVWQPEAFVFPSMLTNGLFMASLCLMLVVFQSFLDARLGWIASARGAIAIGLLMNIHSYDVLTIAFVMAGFAAMQSIRRDIDAAWLVRAAAIAAGVIPAALWFAHVLRSDAVFRARAATETYSASFRQVLFGYGLLMVLGISGLALRLPLRRQRAGLGLLAVLILVCGSAAHAGDGYSLGPAGWGLAAAAALAALLLLATEDPPLNLVLAWAVMGLVGLYFPALFQRKLAMGLSIPWAILAALGFSELVKRMDRNPRNLATVLGILILSGSSVRWMFRERWFIDNDVSNTTVHPVYLSRDETAIIAKLGSLPGRKVVLALPGIPSPARDRDGNGIPDTFAEPTIPDLNPILSGLAGAYTYAGHWSETPMYAERRTEATRVFLAQTPDEARTRLLQSIDPDYVVAPSPETFSNGLADLSRLGTVAYAGSRFMLIQMKPRQPR